MDIWKTIFFFQKLKQMCLIKILYYVFKCLIKTKYSSSWTNLKGCLIFKKNYEAFEPKFSLVKDVYVHFMVHAWLFNTNIRLWTDNNVFMTSAQRQNEIKRKSEVKR